MSVGLFVVGSVSGTSGWAQQSVDASRFHFFTVRLYMSADEALSRMGQMRKTLGGEINTDDQESVFVKHTRYTRSIVWETDQFTLIADLLQYRKRNRMREALVGMSVHPKSANPGKTVSWFQEAVSRYGPPTFSSQVGSDAEKSHYFCKTKDAKSCEAEEPLLILGHNYILLSDCGYIDRITDPLPAGRSK